MRVLAVSDLHVDYEENARWVTSLSRFDHRGDVLILAGDVSHSLPLLAWSFSALVERFAHVIYVPGNHDLWVLRDDEPATSLDKLERVRTLAQECGVSVGPYRARSVSIVPLLGWYDYSFAASSRELDDVWADYRACRWPPGVGVAEVAQHLTGLNDEALATRNEIIISFSHFLPRIDVMPDHIPLAKRIVYPVLGTTRLEQQVRTLGSVIHVYGHSHVNRRVTIDGVQYINNALGYPSETAIAARQLLCVYDGLCAPAESPRM